MRAEHRRHHEIVRGVGMALLTLILGVGTSSAQSAALGTFNGRVGDDTRGALPGVSVVATGPALLVPQVATVTDQNGDYRIGELPPGVYQLTFELLD